MHEFLYRLQQCLVRRSAGLAVAILAGVYVPLFANAAEASPICPNIILVLAGDLGYGDAVVHLRLGADYTDTGAMAQDQEDGDITGGIVVGGDSVDTAVEGTYTITYDVADSRGNPAAQVRRTVIVEIDNPPAITLLGDAIVNLTVGNIYADAGATAEDAEDGDLTSDIIVGGDAVDSDNVGTYTMTYDVTDSAGNTATQMIRTVNIVVPTVPPPTTQPVSSGGGLSGAVESLLMSLLVRLRRRTISRRRLQKYRANRYLTQSSASRSATHHDYEWFVRSNMRSSQCQCWKTWRRFGPACFWHARLTFRVLGSANGGCRRLNETSHKANAMITLSLKLQFVLGFMRHPSQAWHRLREISRIAAAPPPGKAIPTDRVEVEVIPVTAADSLGKRLVEIYSNNPSPYVSGPTSLERLARHLGRGIRYFLLVNGKGETVGSRAFDPESKMFISSVTDFACRGKGYQISAGVKLRKLLVAEGYRSFRAAVMRSNTRMLRNMVAAGWDMVPDQDNPDVIQGTLRVDVD